MICPKCGSEQVSVQMVNEVSLKTQHHGIMWWLFIGWWWVPCKWLVFTIPALIFKIFGHKKQKAINRQRMMCICQKCGHTYRI